MPNKTGTIHIKWIRSGIGFTRKQKEIVRSIGLHRLNQVVERPDTAHFHGLVSKVSHLVEVVDPCVAPVWTGLPEYQIIPAQPAVAAGPPRGVAESTPADPAAGAGVKTAAPAKKTAAAKSRAAASSASEVVKGSEKPKRKAAPTKPAGSARKESKPRKGKQ